MVSFLCYYYFSTIVLNYCYSAAIFSTFLVGKTMSHYLLISIFRHEISCTCNKACYMKEMIAIYHENLLLAPPGSFNNEVAITDDNTDKYLREELSPNRNFRRANEYQSLKKDTSVTDRMELPVNNFLKTMKEIESEFYFVLNSIKTAINEMPDSFDTFDRLMKKNETTIHLNITELKLSGEMEENY